MIAQLKTAESKATSANSKLQGKQLVAVAIAHIYIPPLHTYVHACIYALVSEQSASISSAIAVRHRAATAAAAQWRIIKLATMTNKEALAVQVCNGHYKTG